MKVINLTNAEKDHALWAIEAMEEIDEDSGYTEADVPTLTMNQLFIPDASFDDLLYRISVQLLQMAEEDIDGRKKLRSINSLSTKLENLKC